MINFNHIKMDKSKEYTLNSEDKTFKIRINLSSKISIEANEIDKIKGVF